MAQEIITFLESSVEIPYIGIFVILYLLLLGFIYDFKICKLSDKNYQRQIEELKKENNHLRSVLSCYGKLDN